MAPSSGELSVKQARVASWSDVGGREAALVQRCAAGDEAASAELVAEHQRMVVQLAINLLGDRDEALDLSQEVFLRVFRTIHRFRGQSSLRTWIYRIAVNQARNRHRFWRRRHRADQVSLDQHVAAHGECSSGGEPTPDRVLAQKELADRLHDALERLPFDQRTAIVLREVDGLSYEEIAFSLGRGRRHGQVAADARPPGAARGTARGEDDMKTPHLRGDAPAAAGVSRRRAAGRRSDCRPARTWTGATRARPTLADLRLLGAALRSAARPGATSLSHEEAPRFDATRRQPAEGGAGRVARSRACSEMFDDMHLVYAGVGAAAATAVCVVIMLSMMRFATDRAARFARPPMMSRSLAAPLECSPRPGRARMRWRSDVPRTRVGGPVSGGQRDRRTGRGVRARRRS